MAVSSVAVAATAALASGPNGSAPPVRVKATLSFVPPSAADVGAKQSTTFH
jgi:hypothetical protein